jgi:hypothetical protein
MTELLVALWLSPALNRLELVRIIYIVKSVVLASRLTEHFLEHGMALTRPSARSINRIAKLPEVGSTRESSDVQ